MATQSRDDVARIVRFCGRMGLRDDMKAIGPSSLDFSAYPRESEDGIAL